MVSRDNQKSKRIEILYVEDEPVIRKITQETLKSTSPHLYVAGNGQEGLELFKQHHPPIIVTDLMMPVMDGLAMIEAIRKIPGVTPYVIVLTAYNEADILMRAIELKVDRYLVKPIQSKQVIESINEAKKKLLLESQIHEAQQYYDALMYHFIVSKADPRGIITFANNNFSKISGYSLTELIGKNHNIIRHPDMPKSLFQNLWTTIKQKKVWTGIIKNRKKDGGLYIVDASIFPILDEENNIKEYVAIRQNITELELLKEEKQKKEELLREQKQEREILEKVNRAKDDFLVMFTHELKTPLNAIINFANYLLKKLRDQDYSDPEKLAHLAESVKKNGTFMLEVVTNLLDIAKLKAGKLTFHPSLFSLKQLMEELRHEYELILQEEQIEVTWNLRNDIVIKTDMYRYRQIVSNIFSNAIKYGHGKIEIILEKDHQKPRGYTLKILDNGPGIQDPQAVFNLYTQEGEMIKHSQQGTGIGLHLVKILSDELGLTVAVSKSERLGGAEFTISPKHE